MAIQAMAARLEIKQEGKMVGRAGFEPATNWLKANCSTN